MEKEPLYWMSTLPQVSAALVAFIGFLALDSLDEMDFDTTVVLMVVTVGIMIFAALPSVRQ
jgi:hypothetical protein